jgi:hypothetical protein
VGLLFEPGDKSACSLQDHVEIIDSKKQQEPVTSCRMIGAAQGGMLMGTPLVEAEQDSSIRIDDLPKVVMGGERLRLTEQHLVPFEAVQHIACRDDRPRALMRSLLLPNETQDQRPRARVKRDSESKGGWQTLMRWIVRYLAVRSPAKSDRAAGDSQKKSRRCVSVMHPHTAPERIHLA